jgi:hypothetical protein
VHRLLAFLGALTLGFFVDHQSLPGRKGVPGM